MKKKLILLLLCAMSLSLYAQTDPSGEAPSKTDRFSLVKEALSSLQQRKATMIVRLPSNHKKMQALERLSRSKDLNEKDTRKMEEMLTVTRNLTPAFNARLMTAFSEEFKFAEVLFMHDTASVSLKNGQTAGIFLNKQVESDAAIKLATDKFYVLSLDYDGFPKAINLNDFDTLDEDLKKLPPPFPQDARTNIFASVKILLMSDNVERQTFVMNKMVGKYNKKLLRAAERFL